MQSRSFSLIVMLLVLMLGALNTAQATVLYGTSGKGGAISTLYSIDTGTGEATLIGNVGYAVNGLESYNGVLYGTTSINDPSYHGLITIDKTTGAGSVVGSGWGGSITASTLVEMAIDSAGKAYAWGEGWDELYSVDLNLGIGNRVGPSGLSTAAIGLSFDSSDNLILINQQDQTYSIDTSTGASTWLASNITGDSGPSHHGDTDDETGLYWGLDKYPSVNVSDAINIIDFSTMTLTDNLSLDTPMHTLAFDTSPVPIPGAVWLFGTGLLGIIGIKRKKD